ncbi:DUF262 domain-containing protein [Bacteroides acidifaciens]|uniref:DUF262 domain-containing protein n=1 Tax=Bacteroides acidifaciens TaxID=85831 RepID=UPI002594C5F9|nr:DUF262 domain-containing protein [Bacteroides acidifaciens]
MSNILLETKYVGRIKGDFYLPDYQRGYRWTRDEIKLLLDDIYESNGQPYCLQPIVVKKNGNKFELIDGQQRLTTIYLICKYMESKLGDLYEPNFKLEYETRKESARFLTDLDFSLRDKNIDFHFIADAFEYIDQYFTEKSNGERRQMAAYLTKLNEYFMSSVSVIWYEVDTTEDGIELFERLNIGKIPLTSSELVKALFLKDCVRDQMSGRQEEVSLQWDMIEHELRKPSFWGFLSNTDGDQMPTRIDLLLDLISGKSEKNKESYFTFFYFDNKINELSNKNFLNPLLEVWSSIYHVFLTLREWYANHDFYHKIGFLITTGVPLLRIYEVWQNGANDTPLAKDEFLSELNRMISESIGINDREDLLSLSYDNKKDRLQKVLLLFNVETERLMDERKRRFPFDKHKESIWSLEHIHAQNAESLKKNKDILSWLESHFSILESSENDIFAAPDELKERMSLLIEQLQSGKDPGNVRERFKEIQQEVIALFTQDNGLDRVNPYLHELANMALLDASQNAALSNSVFDVKRHRVIDYDKEGKYIPICTKHVFFKYYTQDNPSLFFWGETDRKNYVDAIEAKIAPYYSGIEQNQD